VTRIIDATDCLVCGHQAQRELVTDTSEMTIECDRCGSHAETEIVTGTTGKHFWQETRLFPMDEGGVNRGPSVVRPSGTRDGGHQPPAGTNSVEKPTGDSELL
jgi:hypothetical protein